MKLKRLKLLAHFVTLAAVLLALPLVCCLLGGYDSVLEGVRNFPPRTEDWGANPANLWNVRRPFNWWWFGGMAVFTYLCMAPLVRRGLRALKAPPRLARQRGAFPAFGWAGVAILVVAWVFAWSRFEFFRPYQPHTYFPLWLGLILVLNALTLRRSSHSPLTDHPWAYLLTFPVSSLFWWFFEYLNRYVWNWYYVGIEGMSALEYTLYATLCFSTVLPGVTAMAAFLGTFRPFDDANCGGMGRVDVRGWRCVTVFLLVALAGLTGIVFCPEYTFGLLWISPLTMFVLVQVLFREPCVLDRLKVGEWGLVFRYSIASLGCGLCWETWNYYSFAKWIYSVPFVHAFQIWEMPLIGFAGYLPFGIECAAIVYWLYRGVLGEEAQLP